MPLLSFDRVNQWVPLDFMLKTDKKKPLMIYRIYREHYEKEKIKYKAKCTMII